MPIGFQSYQKLEIVGNVGRDPELNVTPDGTPVTKFSVAVGVYRGKDDKGNAKNVTIWYNVICWRTLAEQVEKFIQKGEKVLVIGNPDVRPYVSKDGDHRVSMDLIADTVVQLSKTPSGSQEKPSEDPFIPDYPD